LLLCLLPCSEYATRHKRHKCFFTLFDIPKRQARQHPVPLAGGGAWQQCACRTAPCASCAAACLRWQAGCLLPLRSPAACAIHGRPCNRTQAYAGPLAARLHWLAQARPKESGTVQVVAWIAPMMPPTLSAGGGCVAAGAACATPAMCA
jgi:hypothetical protein